MQHHYLSEKYMRIMPFHQQQLQAPEKNYAQIWESSFNDSISNHTYLFPSNHDISILQLMLKKKNSKEIIKNRTFLKKGNWKSKSKLKTVSRFPLKSQPIIYDAKVTLTKKRIENEFQMNKFSPTKLNFVVVENVSSHVDGASFIFRKGFQLIAYKGQFWWQKVFWNVKIGNWKVHDGSWGWITFHHCHRP